MNGEQGLFVSGEYWIWRLDLGEVTVNTLKEYSPAVKKKIMIKIFI